MTREEFKRRHEPRWQRLEKLLDGLDAGSVRVGSVQWKALGGQDLAEFDRLYRLVCKHLALARLRLYGNDLVDRLNALALRAHHHFYGGRRGYGQRALRFVAADFPALVRRKWRLVAVAAFLFAGPLVAVAAAIVADPGLVHSILPPDQVRSMEEMYDPGSEYRTVERAAASDTAMFGFYIRNNIGIAFQTFGGGILLGAGSAFFLIFNGVAIGTVGTHLVLSGYSSTFLSFIAGHSALEVIAIVIAGAAGLNLGWSFIAPGALTRGAALRNAALESVALAVGAAALLVAAAAVEAYWSSSSTIPNPVKYVAGCILWLLVPAYLVLAGRRFGS